jgi:hypothetical protein
MKRFVSFVSILVFGFNSFAQNTLTRIPTPPHIREVDVFFKDEKPTESYFRTTVLEADGSAQDDYNSLLRSLKTKAQKAGADALLGIEDKFVGNRRKLTAFGIKYFKNINYLDSLRLVKRVKFTNLDRNQPDDFVELSPDGDINKSSRNEAQNLYRNLLEKLDYDFLVNDQSPNWKETRRDNLPQQRSFWLKNEKKMEVFVNYDKQSVRDVEVRTFAGRNQDLVLVPKTWAGKNPSMVSIYKNTVLKNRVNYTYDSQGRPLIADWSVYDGKTERPFLRVEYEYFSKAEIAGF